MKRHINPYWPWRIFLGILAFLIMVYMSFFIGKLYEYAILTKQVPAASVHWSVYSRDEDLFAARADYTFFLDGKQYAGQTIWDDGERYPNPWALNHLMESLSKQNWQVWFKASDPNYSSLQKKFPTKECLSTVILWGVFAYFVMLGKYADKTRSSHGNDRIEKPHPRRRAAASHVSTREGDESDEL